MVATFVTRQNTLQPGTVVLGTHNGVVEGEEQDGRHQGGIGQGPLFIKVSGLVCHTYCPVISPSNP
jgi:hypothetical protein